MLGDYYYDALTSSDVQKWIDTMTRRGWWSEEKGSKNEKTKKVRRTYTFTDLVRRANVAAVVRRALTGHVTEEMQRHYSTVGLDEKRAAIAGVLRLVPPASGGNEGGSGGARKTEKAVG
jgi:hypothetical protein